MNYDFLIIGAGLYGSICAYELTRKKYSCLVLEKRNHIGGNCYTETRDDIHLHLYGPHIFHTSNTKVWNWINQFVTFNNFIFNPVANYQEEIYSLPFNMWTFSKIWNITHPQQAKDIIKSQSSHIIDIPKNLEEQAIKLVGFDIYQKLIKGYTEKQWMKPATELPKEIITRLPIRFSYDGNYFNDIYQGIPIGGYTQIFDKLLNNINTKLGINYLKNKEYWNSQAKRIIYTGPVDAYYNYCFGDLEYKTNKFNHRRINIDNYQGTAVMNFTDIEIPYTRCIEHKHFEKKESDITWITHEYPSIYSREQEPYYPVNDKHNNEKYQKYAELNTKESNVYFGGRLAEYKYYDMDKVILSALNFIEQIT